MVGESAAATTSACGQSTGTGQFNPLFCGQVKAVSTGLVFNSLEFDGIKPGVMDFLPDHKKKHGILVLQPLFNECAAAIKAFDHTCQQDVILLSLRQDGDDRTLYANDRFLVFAHSWNPNSFSLASIKAL